MNIRKFYFRQLFNDLMPIYPLYILMFQDKGVSVQQISILLVIWSISTVVLEIPSGIIADRWSRKLLVSMGSLFQGACYLTWLLSDGFFMYAIGFVLWGIGGAFKSGAEEALLYDSLKQESRDDTFDRCLGKGRFLSGVGNIIASVAGGFIGMKYSYNSALLLSITSGLISAVIAFTYKEANYYKSRSKELLKDTDHDTLREAFSFLLKNKEILIFSLLLITVVSTAGILDEYDQLIARDYGLSTVGIGIWAAIRFLLIAIGGYMAHGIKKVIQKISKKKDAIRILGIVCMLASACLVLAGLLKFIAIMSVYGLFYLIMSAGDVIGEDYIQARIEDEGRSTVHSILSLSYNLYGSLFILAYGLMLRWIKLLDSLVIVAAYMVVLITLWRVLYARLKRVNGMR